MGWLIALVLWLVLAFGQPANAPAHFGCQGGVCTASFGGHPAN